MTLTARTGRQNPLTPGFQMGAQLDFSCRGSNKWPPNRYKWSSNVNDYATTCAASSHQLSHKVSSHSQGFVVIFIPKSKLSSQDKPNTLQNTELHNQLSWRNRDKTVSVTISISAIHLNYSDHC